jgi:hypothetical protein
MANADYQVSNKHTTKFIGTLNESISLRLARRAGATGECMSGAWGHAAQQLRRINEAFLGFVDTAEWKNRRCR